MSDMLTNIGRSDAEALRTATVLSVRGGRAKIELATGAVIPDALLVGSTVAGAAVRVAYQGGQYVVYGSGSDAVPSVSLAGTSVGGVSAGGAPSPHDWLGIHHTLPSGAAGLFAATPSGSSGTVSMRGIMLSDFSAAADTRYALRTRAITAGAGLTGNGDLTADFTIAVGAGNGIAADTDSVRVVPKASGGLSVDSGGVFVSAGNGIAVGATVAVDQNYAFTWGAAHTFNARPTFAAGATVSAGQTLRFGADVDLQRGGANVLTLGTGDAMRSSSYQSGVRGWGISDAGDAELNNVRVRGEFAAAVFRVNEISATAGTLGVYLSASTVHADFTTPASVGSSVNGVQIKNSTPSSAVALFAAGDRLQVKAWNGTALVNAWFTVNPSPVTSTGYTTYSLKLESGSTNADIGAGTAIVDHGTASGGGALTLSADGAIGAAPNLSVTTNAGSPWSTTTLRARLGNLSGAYDYGAGSNIYGFAAGDSSATFVSVDATNGFRVVRGSTPRFVVDTSGNLSINNSAGAAVVSMDTSGNASIAGVLTVGTSGEIRQGSGSLTSSPATFTGLRIWSETTGGNTLGRIAGYNSGTPQWYADSDGKLKAGGGDVTLDSDGVSLVSWVSSRGSIGSVNGYRFSASSTTFCGMYAQTNSTVQTAVSILNHGDAQPSIVIDAYDTSTVGGSNSDVSIVARGPSYTTAFFVGKSLINAYGAGVRITSGVDLTSAAAGTLYVSGSTALASGLNVGSATGAATGEIKASAGVSGTTGTFTGQLNAGSATGTTAGVIKTTVSGTSTNTVTINGDATSLVFINRAGTGAQTSEFLVQSNNTDVARFGWNASGYVDVSALLTNNDVRLTPSGTGKVRIGSTLIVAGDQGGVASTVGLSNVSDTAANSTGTGTIKFKGATSRDSSGFIKIYVGTTAYYVPFFSAVTG
jgi:hypothetical protein